MAIHPDPDGFHRRRQHRGQPPRRARERRWRRAAWLLLMPGLPLLASVLAVAALRVVNPPTTAFVLAAARDGLAVAPLRFVPRSALGTAAALGVIAAEDQKFPLHRGFDVAAIEAALAAGRDGRHLRGASTISQQLAKNLFLWSGRSWLRKALEAWFTVLLEHLLPKRRILELYLNVVEYGQGVFGIGNAAERYFGRAPAALTAAQGALLAAVLPAPKRWRVDAPSAGVRARQAWILRQVQALGGAATLRRIDWFD